MENITVIHAVTLSIAVLGAGIGLINTRTEEPNRTVVGDGRHRLFVTYRHAATQNGFTVAAC